MCIHSIGIWSMDINFKLQKVTFKAVRSIRINEISGKMQKYMKQWCLQQHTTNAKCNTAPAGTESERKTHLHISQSTIYFSKWKVNAFFSAMPINYETYIFISFRFVVLHSFRFFPFTYAICEHWNCSHRDSRSICFGYPVLCHLKKSHNCFWRKNWVGSSIDINKYICVDLCYGICHLPPAIVDVLQATPLRNCAKWLTNSFSIEQH